MTGSGFTTVQVREHAPKRFDIPDKLAAELCDELATLKQHLTGADQRLRAAVNAPGLPDGHYIDWGTAYTLWHEIGERLHRPKDPSGYVGASLTKPAEEKLYALLTAHYIGPDDEGKVGKDRAPLRGCVACGELTRKHWCSDSCRRADEGDDRDE